MRDLINILSEASRVEPSPQAIKFWITERGSIKFIGATHHFDYIMASGMVWGEVFDKGWIRGFVETHSNLICFAFDQRNVNRSTLRAMAKLIDEYDIQTVIWDDIRHGADYGSERTNPKSFINDLRLLAEEVDPDHLYWFWFNSRSNHLHHIEDGTHTLAAIEELNLDGIENIDFDTEALEDYEVFKLAISQNWVRGRYDDNQLMLQGKRRDVHKCAKWIADRWPISVLYIDFVQDDWDVSKASFDKSSSTALRGSRLEFFLNRGWIPSAMIQETLKEGVFKISAGGSFSEFKIWENPTARQINNLMNSVDEVRGLIDDRDDLYVWDAYQATHHAIAKELGLVIIRQFSVSGDIVSGDYVETLNENKNFTRAFGTELKNDFDDDELFEAPISDISYVGDWEKSSSYRSAQDRKLLTNPKAVKKIKSLWKYPDYVDYNIILVNNSEANNWTEEGVVDKDRLKAMFPKSFSDIEPLLKEDEVNIIFTNNKGAARVPMTGWIMAHRFGHALNRLNKNYYFKEAVGVIERYLKDLMEDYGIGTNSSWDRVTPALTSTTARNLAHAIGTFKSAREKKLRTTYEMVYELLAQYIINGTVKFNPPPRSVKVRNTVYRFRYDDEQYERAVSAIVDDLPVELNSYFDAAIHSSVGKILVM